jgi:beta-galactosidase
LINGERLLLQGSHFHEDHADTGAVIGDDDLEKLMRQIKAMGVNFLRLGHYQHDARTLEWCDTLGILVWEEIPWCRGGLGGVPYQELCREQLRNMITQHRHHPSVIIWGLGNENDWPGDDPEFDPIKIRNFMKDLHSIAKGLDHERMTAIQRCAFCADIVDVYSPSIWAGWYRGAYQDYRQATIDAIAEHKHMLHVEWGADNHAGRISENPYQGIEGLHRGGDVDERTGDFQMDGGDVRVSRDGDWSESYYCDLIDWHLKEQLTLPNLIGTAFWVYKDFSTPLRPDNPVPFVNQKGCVARDMTPKDSYFVYQSYWTNTPMVHLPGALCSDRWGKTGEPITLRAYSNCERVELSIDGVSQGIRTRSQQDFPAAGLRWEANLKPGKHELVALGYHVDEQVQTRRTITVHSHSWTAGAEFSLRSHHEPGAAIRWVTAVLHDAAGNACLDDRRFVRWSLAGNAELIVDQGTPWGSERVQLATGQARIAIRGPGPATVSLVSEGAEPIVASMSLPRLD